MLKVNLADGQTLSFDLDDDQQAAEWTRTAARAWFQEQIRALTLSINGVQLSLLRPRGFEPVFLLAERIKPNGRSKGGERLFCHAGDISVVATAHHGQCALRVDIARSGKLKFNPLSRSLG